MQIDRLTPALGAQIFGVDVSATLTSGQTDAIYDALLNNLVIFFRDTRITPQAHLELARGFGDLDAPHPHYPHVDGYENIVLLENDLATPPDTNSWHTDLTFSADQPFASVLVARTVPPTGGDTIWSSCHAAFDRLPDGMKRDLQGLEAIHDLGDFRNSFAEKKDNQSAEARLNDAVSRFGNRVRPLIDSHPVTGAKFLNFNEAFVTHIVGLTANDSNALKAYLANHMNRPEDQVRWRWRAGDLAIWDNRCTMHYAVADYLPQYRCMNRVTVIRDKRDGGAVSAA